MTAATLWEKIKQLSPNQSTGQPMPWTVIEQDLAILTGAELDFVRSNRDEIRALADSDEWEATFEEGRWHFRPPSSSETALPISRGRTYLEEVEVGGLGAVLDLAFTPTPPPGDRGQWIVLLGDNASGKTTILRAIVLALLPRQFIGTAMRSAYGGGRYTHRAAEADAAYVSAKLGGARFHRLLGRLPEILIDPNEAFPIQDVPVFAYGSRRSYALNASIRSTEGADADADADWGAFATLFDASAPLIDTVGWLLRSAEDSAYSDFVHGTLRLLESVLPIKATLTIARGELWCSDEGGNTVEFRMLSDGVRVFAAWIVDFLSRWSTIAVRHQWDLNGNLASCVDGLVIIDEIDLHLHPEWQRGVITSLRAALPRVSFVVTTHSPLTLHGCKDGEVYICSREARGAPIKIEQRDVPKGADTDKVLTGRWFGLESTLDQDTLALLERHRVRLRNGEEPGSAELQEIETLIRRRLGSFAETSAERLALSIAASHFPDDPSLLSLDEREALRRNVAAEYERRRRAAGEREASSGDEGP